MSPDFPMADAAPTRRSRRAAAAAAEEIVPVVLTRAELRRRRAEAETAAQAETALQAEPTEQLAPTEHRAAGESTVPVPVTHPFDSIAEVVAEATAAAPTSRRRDRHHAEPGVSTLVDTVAADAIPLSFVAAVAEPCLVDEFERAARTFSFTGQTPIQADAVVEPPIVPATAHVARRGHRPGRKRVAAASFSLGVMTIVGQLAVGTTTPWSAVAASSGAADIVALAPTPQPTENIQAYVSSTDGESPLERSVDYDVASMADLAADSGVTQFAGTWVNDPTADVQWPFPVGVPISAAYGSQTYLSKFSSPHRGVDLTPGVGAEIHVVADGTVRIATQAGGDYGVTVVVDHVVDGQLVSTRYAHMQYGSLQVSTGDIVKAGDVIGRVGSTGKATGPHLHFEVLLGGTVHTDPMAWMRQHTEE